MRELEKSYDPKKYEDTIYKSWEESGFFNPDTCIEKGVCDKDAKTFSLVLPPPNVTGTLHIGHAVMLAVEDTMVRYHRMKGERTLWVPGTDHAALATQEKVEKIMWNEEKITRHDLGREKFLKRVEQFAQDSHDTIVNQAKKMGTSMDWSREYYSLDDQRSLAVRTAFVEMYNDGLIYRGDRIVNWDPKMQSNVSNIEVERKEEKAPFYYFKYGPFEICTVRPETKFCDKYVVMHPDDARYAKYAHGDTFECEWINGPITATIIKDEAADPEFGSGVMTITPWHSTEDFFIAERHGLDKEQIIDLHGNLMEVAGEFAGMSIEEARLKVVEKLDKKGLLIKTDEDYVHQLATNSRGGGVIEPQIMKQWWVGVKKEFIVKDSKIDGVASGEKTTIQKISQHVVNTGQIDIIPKRFEKDYFNWVDNYLDWCISRQLWYGHRIPAWYRNEEVYVGITPPDGEGWVQDPDTLDTWFSAGMFSFSPLGWPASTEDAAGESLDMHTYHPLSVIETGYDILTFWLIRMVLMTTYLRGEVPFKTVYLHGLVRDEKGRKMSKSLGNIINPLDVCKDYGTDAVRLSLMIGATPGNDSKLSEEKIASYRNFANKLWNISRFMLLNMSSPTIDVELPKPKTLADVWIFSRLASVVTQVSEDIEQYRFSQAGELLRDFTWNELADWYLEIAKIEGEKSVILNYILNTILKLWHPFMPFVTEAIWQEVYEKESMLMVAPWPKALEIDQEGSQDFSRIQQSVTAIRKLRAENNIPPAKKLIGYVKLGQNTLAMEENKHVICSLARLELLSFVEVIPENTVSFVEAGVEFSIDFAGTVDSDKERKRIQKEIDSVFPYIQVLENKLAGEFAQKAPEMVVLGEKNKLVEAKDKLEKLQKELEKLQ